MVALISLHSTVNVCTLNICWISVIKVLYCYKIHKKWHNCTVPSWDHNKNGYIFVECKWATCVYKLSYISIGTEQIKAGGNGG